MPTGAPISRKIQVPIDVRVGTSIHKFVHLRDVYEKCRKDPAYFQELVNAVNNSNTTELGRREHIERATQPLAQVLLDHGQILPQKCFEALLDKLMVDDFVKFAEWCLNQRGCDWEKMRRSEIGIDGKIKPKGRKPRGKKPPPGSACHWDDCPDSRT